MSIAMLNNKKVYILSIVFFIVVSIIYINTYTLKIQEMTMIKNIGKKILSIKTKLNLEDEANTGIAKNYAYWHYIKLTKQEKEFIGDGILTLSFSKNNLYLIQSIGFNDKYQYSYNISQDCWNKIYFPYTLRFKECSK